MITAVDSDIDYHVAWRLMTLREEKVVSRQEMSELTNIPTETIYRMETCNAAIGAPELSLFADVLGVTPGYFFEDLEPIPTALGVKRRLPDQAALGSAKALARFFLTIDDQDIRNRFGAVVRNAALIY